MGKSYVRIIQAIALAAAVLGLLLTTPSLEARTIPVHKSKKHKPKKMKIVFDGSEPAAPPGELGDEIVQPRSNVRTLAEPGTVVHFRGSSVDDLWKKNAAHTNAKSKTPADDNPDLIEPLSTTEIEKPASSRLRHSGPLLAENPSVDESALGSFKKSPRKTSIAARVSRPSPKQVAYLDDRTEDKPLIHPVDSRHTKPVTIQPLPEPIMEFDDLKPKTTALSKPTEPPLAQTSVRPTARPLTSSRIYLRNAQLASSSNSLTTRMRPEEPSEFKFNFAFENTTSMGRQYELQTPGGRNFMMKNELFIGTTHSSGWGMKLSADYVTTSNDDSTKDVHEMGDPSVIVMHPSFYKDRDLNVYGQARYYLPASATSKASGLQQFAYYLLADVKLVDQFSLSNALVPRYYYQAVYADSDAFSLVSDSTEIERRFDWFGIGFGQRSQVESHEATAPGTSAELYPFLEFVGISNAVLAAKVYVPIFINGVVNGAPDSPSGPLVDQGFANLQAEFSARLSW